MCALTAFVTSIPFRQHLAKRLLPRPLPDFPRPVCKQDIPPPTPDRDAKQRLARIQSIPDLPKVDSTRSLPFDNTPGQLFPFLDYIRSGLNNDIDKALSKPSRVALASSIAILFGFFSATSASTIIGSVADWDPLAAFVLIIWTELFTKFYYSRPRSNRILQLINAFKIGLIYGMTVDAYKLST